jgi:sigma-B regulation protein RsbU (phosphoserine phosphatase)
MLLWDATTRRIVMANAGALPPMICRGTEILKIRVEGVPLGLLDAREYEEVTFQAEAGDIVVLYSDGITDHMSAAGTEFGRERLAQIVRASCKLSADGLILEIFKELDKFSMVAFDDQSVFVMKVK